MLKKNTTPKSIKKSNSPVSKTGQGATTKKRLLRAKEEDLLKGVNAGRNFPTLAGRIFPHPWEFWAFSPSLKTGTPF